MTCKQLGGGCNQEFLGETFEQITDQLKQHGVEMFKKQDQAHIDAMEVMREKYSGYLKMQKWMEKKRKDFEKK